jgi:nitroreductase
MGGAPLPGKPIMPLSDDALDVIFRTARTLRDWAPRAVSSDTLHAIYELMKWGPTSSNICPARSCS